MGYYVFGGPTKGKAAWLVENHGGAVIAEKPDTYEEIPEGQGLIVVIDQGAFDAAYFMFNEGEFDAFTDPGGENPMPRTYVLLSDAKIQELTGFGT